MSGKLPVRRSEAPMVPVDYRFDMNRGSVFGLMSAAIAVGVLIFVSGLVIGVRLNLAEAVAEPAGRGSATAGVEADAEGGSAAEVAARSGAAAGAGAAMQVGSSAAPESPAGATASTVSESPAGAATRTGSSPAPGSPAGARSTTSVGSADGGSSRTAEVPAVPAAAAPRAPAPAAQPRSAGIQPEGGVKYVLQAGAFRSSANAEALRAALVESGYDARITKTPAAGGDLSRVVIGGFTSEAEAERSASGFRSDTGREVYVMTATEVGL